MTTLLRTPATVVWVLLIVATAVSWALGIQHGLHDHQLSSVIILLIAFIKVRLVGMYFMELREAPNVLRGLFEAYCVIVCTLLLGIFIFA
jgi:heme/copper-type cytochrome/quinol oxidase subunit 4